MKRTEVPASVPWTAVVVFVAVSMGLAWLIALPLWRSDDGLASSWSALVLPVMMLAPGIATVVALLVQRPRPRPVMGFLGLWPIRPARRIIWSSVAAVPAAALLVVGGVFLSAGLGLVDVDLATFSGYAAQLEQAGISELALPIGTLVALQLIAIPLNSLLSIPFALGEELGWRGWLLPALLPLGTWPALLLSGAIWGLWHSPIILLGYNYARPGVSGLALMTAACMIFGILLGWLRLHTGSVWPAVMAHSAFNASAGFISLVIAAGSNPDAAAVGPLGWVTCTLMAITIGAVFLSGGMRKVALTLFPRHETLNIRVAQQADPSSDDADAVSQVNSGGSRS